MRRTFQTLEQIAFLLLLLLLCCVYECVRMLYMYTFICMHIWMWLCMIVCGDGCECKEIENKASIDQQTTQKMEPTEGVHTDTHSSFYCVAGWLNWAGIEMSLVMKGISGLKRHTPRRMSVTSRVWAARVDVAAWGGTAPGLFAEILVPAGHCPQRSCALMPEILSFSLSFFPFFFLSPLF